MKPLAKIAALADAGRLSLDAEELAAAFAEIRELALALQAEQDSPATHSPPRLEGHHEGGLRGFHHLAESYYAKACASPDRVDEVGIGIYYPDDGGGTTGEFVITWSPLSGTIAAQLCVFDEAWSVLPLFRDVLDRLAELTEPIESGEGPWKQHAFPDVSPAQVCAILKECGLQDLTKRDDPYARTPPATHSDPVDGLVEFVRGVMPALGGKQQRDARSLLARLGDKE